MASTPQRFTGGLDGHHSEQRALRSRVASWMSHAGPFVPLNRSPPRSPTLIGRDRHANRSPRRRRFHKETLMYPISVGGAASTDSKARASNRYEQIPMDQRVTGDARQIVDLRMTEPSRYDAGSQAQLGPPDHDWRHRAYPPPMDRPLASIPGRDSQYRSNPVPHYRRPLIDDQSRTVPRPNPAFMANPPHRRAPPPPPPGLGQGPEYGPERLPRGYYRPPGQG